MGLLQDLGRAGTRATTNKPRKARPECNGLRLIDIYVYINYTPIHMYAHARFQPSTLESFLLEAKERELSHVSSSIATGLSTTRGPGVPVVSTSSVMYLSRVLN